MSDIRSKPYSKEGRKNWEDIFVTEPVSTPDPSLMRAFDDTMKDFDDIGIVTSAPEAIRLLRVAKSRRQVETLRRSSQDLVKDWVVVDRANFWREFNYSVPAGLEGAA